jgi:dihydroorotate dehydrogenase (NAD+) catalytic subunit
MADLTVHLGRLQLDNPILVASGTFGYAKEMEAMVDFSKLGGIVPKTVTQNPRAGNPPPRTCETSAGMLNAIGLDNDGLEYFLANHLPYLRNLPTKIIGNIAGKTEKEFFEMAQRISKETGLAALELNLSCPNVSGGVDFAIDPEKTARVIRGVKEFCNLPIIAKLTPNVTDVSVIAQAAAEAGADAVSLVNTFMGLAIDWKKKRFVLGNGTGGLSGPAIKPIALRIVWQVAKKVKIPIIGIGGIASVDDVMEFILAGASAVQLGTVNFYDPTAAQRIGSEIPAALKLLNLDSVSSAVGLLAR